MKSDANTAFTFACLQLARRQRNNPAFMTAPGDFNVDMIIKIVSTYPEHRVVLTSSTSFS